jgi:putative FmdB family regulatory protein
MRGMKESPMPFYEFACLDCGREFSVVLSVKEHERKTITCPGCKSKLVEQLVTTCEVITAKKS